MIATRRVRTILLAALAAASLTLVFAAGASAKPKHGPGGLDFYTPPKHLPGKTHGDLIWWRKLKSDAVLDAARKNDLILYRSVNVDGKASAVSGSIAIPKGKPPKGGWPIIDYAHGTTGIADKCAPTRDDASSSVHGLNSYIYPDLDDWLHDGYAVLRTDYEGLGTPGIHPYLYGNSAGRSVLDIVSASRQLEPSLGKRVAIVGHSQGGHAAIWAAGIAPKWTPKMKVVGTVAFAPASHLAEQVPAVRAIDAPGGGLGGIASLVIRAVDRAGFAVGVPGLLSSEALTIYPETKTECLDELSLNDSFGGINLSHIFDANADLAAFVAALKPQNPGRFDLKAPLRIEQGLGDSTVFPFLTQELQDELVENGSRSTLKTYTGVDHGGVVTGDALADATAFLKKRLK